MQKRLTMLWLIWGTLAAFAGESFPKPPNIKGLQVQMTEDALALGIHHAAINVNLTALCDVAKKPKNPRQTVSGEEFHFNEDYARSLDAQIKPLSDKGIVVYAILLTYPSKKTAVDEICLHPLAKDDYGYNIAAFNTGTEQGKRWLEASIRFLARRWSQPQGPHGRVWGWIIGNEVNSHWLWYNLGKLPLAKAVEEYAKAFRIAYQSISSSNAAARLYTSFDHHWATSMANISAEEATPGRDFLAEFARQIKSSGDIPWHVAWHPYPEDLGNPRAWADKHVTFDFDTSKVTFKNLEVLCRYLQRPEMLYQGRTRSIILSEQGFHTLKAANGEELQAAAYAYAWEKCRHLPMVEAFILHRHVDHAKEGGLRLGLWTHKKGTNCEPDQQKRLYALFQQAGTAQWDQASEFALKVAGLTSWKDIAPKP